MRFAISISCVFFLLIQTVSATSAVKEDNLHIRTWNQFAQNILKFHQQRIKNKNIHYRYSGNGAAGGALKNRMQ